MWVQERLDDAAVHGVAQHEETLTQSLLLDLKIRVPELKIRTFTRSEENRASGADWLWWWRGERQWFGHLVQAKRLQPIAGGTVGYSIGYRPRGSAGEPARPRQIDTLRQAATDLDVPAIYALYNSSTPGQRRAGSCPYIEAGEAAEGVTILFADVADWLLGLMTDVRQPLLKEVVDLPLSALESDARPWSCLAACEITTCHSWPHLPVDAWRDLGFSSAPDEQDLAFGAALTVLLARLSARERQARLDLDDQQLALAAVRRGVRDEPHPGVSVALEFDGDAGVADDVLSEFPDTVAGIVVVQQRQRTGQN